MVLLLSSHEGIAQPVTDRKGQLLLHFMSISPSTNSSSTPYGKGMQSYPIYSRAESISLEQFGKKQYMIHEWHFPH